MLAPTRGAALDAQVQHLRPERERWGTPVRASLVSALTFAALLACAGLVGIDELHFGGLGGTLNDQLGYITTARNLLATGRLHSDVIYPSVLSQNADKDYLYMPGYYFVLAAAYRLLGFGNIPSILPSIVAHIVATVALFLGVQKLFGKDVATISALIFGLFPANLAYALTAMVEPMLTAAVVACLAIFIYLPSKAKVLVGPLLLAIPVFFRETGLIVAIPFTLVILFGQRDGRAGAFLQSPVKSTAVFLILSALVVTAVLKSDVSSGRPSLEPLILLTNDETAIYNDAYFVERQDPDVRDWLAAPVVKFVYNTRVLIGIFVDSTRAVLEDGWSSLSGVEYLELVSLGLMLAGVPLSALAIRYRRRDPLLIGGLGATSVLLVAILGLYFVPNFQAVRILLIAVPFECIACAVRLATLSHSPRSVKYILTGLGMATAVALTVAALRPTDAERAESQRDLEFIESISHDNRFVLVTPVELPFDYLYAHYPVRWAFVPLDRLTFHLLNEKYAVGTTVLDSSSSLSPLTANDLAAEGLTFVATEQLDDHAYEVYKRKF